MIIIRARKARHARDCFAIDNAAIGNGSGMQTREQRLVYALGRYSKREHAYILTPTAYRRLLWYASDPRYDLAFTLATPKRICRAK